MSEEPEIPPESCEGTSDTFASVWVKVEMTDDVYHESEKMEIQPDIQHLQKYSKPKKKGGRRSQTVLKCEWCPYTTVYKGSLKMHAMVHLDTDPLTCDACSYTTKYATSLQRHKFIKHQVVSDENKVVLQCDSCNYTTYFKWNLNAHKRRHASSKQYQCEHCSYSTAYRHNFVKHSKVHIKMTNEFKCNKCPFVTKYTGHIQRHMSQIHNEVSEKANACEFCDFTTMLRWRLNVHKQRSHQENPLKCGRCSFQTHYACQIKKHRKSHFNDVLNSATNSVIENKISDTNECGSADKISNDVFIADTVNSVISVSENKLQNNSGNDTDRTKGIISTESVHAINMTLNENKGQICAINDYNGYRIPKEYLKPETVERHHNGVSMNMSQVNEHNNAMTKGYLYDFVHGINENDRQVSYDNEYTASVRMTEGFIKATGSYYDMVNSVSGHGENYIRKENELNRITESVNQFIDLNTGAANGKETASKLKKPKNYIVDPKCETRKTIQVLESDDTERRFQCVKCTYISKFKAAVIRHYQRLHTNKDRPFKCCNCDFSTKTQDQISLHNKRSQSDGMMICNLCDFSTNFKCTFAMHQRVHYEHKCSVCDYTSRTKYDTQKHFNTVHLGVGFKCKFCDFKSPRRETLLGHEAIHTGNKPFKCDLCSYQSVRRSLLDIHFRRCHSNFKVINGKLQECREIKT